MHFVCWGKIFVGEINKLNPSNAMVVFGDEGLGSFNF